MRLRGFFFGSWNSTRHALSYYPFVSGLNFPTTRWCTHHIGKQSTRCFRSWAKSPPVSWNIWRAEQVFFSVVVGMRYVYQVVSIFPSYAFANAEGNPNLYQIEAVPVFKTWRPISAGYRFIASRCLLSSDGWPQHLLSALAETTQKLLDDCSCMGHLFQGWKTHI